MSHPKERRRIEISFDGQIMVILLALFAAFAFTLKGCDWSSDEELDMPPIERIEPRPADQIPSFVQAPNALRNIYYVNMTRLDGQAACFVVTTDVEQKPKFISMEQHACAIALPRYPITE